jgi:hypothetical protein
VAKCRRVEGQDTCVDMEQCVSAQHFHIPFLKIGGLVRGCGCGVINGMVIIRSICDGGVDRKLVIKGICDRGVGQSATLMDGD